MELMCHTTVILRRTFETTMTFIKGNTVLGTDYSVRISFSKIYSNIYEVCYSYFILCTKHI